MVQWAHLPVVKGVGVLPTVDIILTPVFVTFHVDLCLAKSKKCPRNSRSSSKCLRNLCEMENRRAELCRLAKALPLTIVFQFMTRCNKPSRKGQRQFQCIMLQKCDRMLQEFLQICKAVAIGFAVMGFIGYFVKLIHIPMSVRPLVVPYVL